MALAFRKGLLEKHDAKKVAGIYNALGLGLIGRTSKQLFHVGTVIRAVCNTLFQQVVAQAHIFRIAKSKGCKRSQYVVVASPNDWSYYDSILYEDKVAGRYRAAQNAPNACLPVCNSRIERTLWRPI